MTKGHKKNLSAPKSHATKDKTHREEVKKLSEEINYIEEDVSPEENNMSQDFDDFDFVSHFDENAEVGSDELLPQHGQAAA